jgi:hypothetical protein
MGDFLSRRLILAAGFSPAASRWLKHFAFLSTRLERFYDESISLLSNKITSWLS